MSSTLPSCGCFEHHGEQILLLLLGSSQIDRWCGLQESLFNDVERSIDVRLGRGEVLVQLGQVVGDILQL